MTSHNLYDEKLNQSLAQMQKFEEDVYRKAIEKHFGAFSEEVARECTLIVVTGGVKRLMHDDQALCEIYPLESERTDEIAKVKLKQNYRIF